MTRALLVLLAVLALAGCGGGDDEGPVLSGQERALVEALRDGGVVLVMRHAKTETATDEVEVLGDCAQQRNLNAEGRAQARKLGRDIRALGVPVREVRASPMCRTKETADLAFGRSIPDRRLITPGVVGTAEDDDRRIAALRRMTTAPPGTATVLVTHTGNIGGAFGDSVEEGEVLVVRGERELGVVRPGDWTRLAAGAD